jgi:2-furoyl-CoA dehydrogenase large subunit
MSTPVCIANAVADALGVAEISLPLTPERMLELLRRGSSAPDVQSFQAPTLMP